MPFALALLLAGPVSDPIPGTVWRNPEAVKGFEGMREEMQHLVDTSERGAPRVQHLCAVVEDRSADPRLKPEDAVQGWIHLREGRYLYAIGATDFPPLRDMDILGNASVDLARDVVRSARDIRQPYDRRVTRAYVDRIIRACADHGTSIVLEKAR